jgi:hypothetical protein
MNVLMLIALILGALVALLYLAPALKVLNFVDYTADDATRINHFAAARLLIPTFVSIACAVIAEMRPALLVPLIFPILISVVATVVWIAAGLSRLKA